MTFTTEGTIINCVIILSAFLVGFLAGRLWQVLFGSPGMSLDDAIEAEKKLQEANNVVP